jgi:monofunctional chorismate mutase
MAVRGIRGATTADADTEAAILEATQDLLEAIRVRNQVQVEDIAGIWFTTTRDLSAEFPARAARRLGWTEVPMLCGHEMEVPAQNRRSVARCIRVLMLVNTDRPAGDLRFVYLRGAAHLRDDQ